MYKVNTMSGTLISINYWQFFVFPKGNQKCPENTEHQNILLKSKYLPSLVSSTILVELSVQSGRLWIPHVTSKYILCIVGSRIRLMIMCFRALWQSNHFRVLNSAKLGYIEHVQNGEKWDIDTYQGSLPWEDYICTSTGFMDSWAGCISSIWGSSVVTKQGFT